MVEVPNPAGALRSPAAAGQYNLALVTYFEAIALSNAGLIESFDDRQLPGIADVDPKYLTRDKAGRHVGLPVLGPAAIALGNQAETASACAERNAAVGRTLA